MRACTSISAQSRLIGAVMTRHGQVAVWVLKAARGRPRPFILFLMLLAAAVRNGGRAHPGPGSPMQLMATSAQMSAVLSNVTAPLV
jgi:hypothetical protein